MAFFICFRSVLAVLATILKCLYLVYATHIVSFKYLPVAWALIYGKKDGVQCNRHETRKYCVFNHSSAVFSGKNRNNYYLSNSQIKYKVLHILPCTCTCFFSNDFAGFREILLIAQSCMIFAQFCKIAKFQKACLWRRSLEIELLSFSYIKKTKYYFKT